MCNLMLGDGTGYLPFLGDTPHTVGDECGSSYILLGAEPKKASGSTSICQSLKRIAKDMRI